MERRLKDFYGVGNESSKYAERVYDDFVHFLTNLSHNKLYKEDKDIFDYIPGKYLEGIEIKYGINNNKYYNLYLNLFLIFKLTKYKYNLNEVEELILEENFSTAIKNYSTLVKTDDSDLCVYRDFKDMYTLDIDKEFIDKVRLLSNFKINKQSSINLGMDIYNFYNHPIFNEDIKNIINSNIEVNDLLKLVKYTKDINLINRYIDLFNTEDKQYKELLLEFIKPISEDITFYDTDEVSMNLYPCCSDNKIINSFYNFIRNDKENNNIDECTRFYKYKKLKINVYFLKLFENYFINKIDELEIIANLEDRCEVMASLIKFKNSVIKNIYIVNEEANEIDFDIKNCDQLKEEFDNIFNEITNIKDKRENNKVKVKGGVFV